MSDNNHMFANGFVERHDLEQYFWTKETVQKLMDALKDYDDCCCLTTPSLAHAWHLENKDQTLTQDSTIFLNFDITI